MRILLPVLAFLASAECSDNKKVYICNSPHATKYHYTENCRGLSGCQHQVITTTLEEAEKQKKTLCNWERNR
jgi:hypothetical protein